MRPGKSRYSDAYEKLQFYCHPDHLGSSSYITNLDGEVVQHIEYVPFGEVFFEERNSVWNTPYLFNAKEFDEETGLYYYGARYYDPRISLWMSADNEHENHPNVSTYTYCLDNPIIFSDPDGNSVWTKAGKALIKIGAKVSKQGLKALTKTATYADAVSDIVGSVNTLTDANASGWDKLGAGVSLASELLPISISDAKDIYKLAKGVSSQKKLKESAKIGQEAYRQIEKGLKENGAKIEETIILKDGTRVRKDAIRPDGTAVIIKPDTPSGHRSAIKRKKMMKKMTIKPKQFFMTPKTLNISLNHQLI